MRIRIVSISLLALLSLQAWVLLDASARRERHDERAEAELVRLVGLPDMALSSNARWLRHPGHAEASAAIADAPGALDVDPAGAWISPPAPILREGSGTIELRR